MLTHPWPQSSAYEVAGKATRSEINHRAARTPLIPPGVIRILFNHAESILKRAPGLLDERDARDRYFRSAELTNIRTACFFLLGILTGMRSEEIVGIELGAGRTETKNGHTYHWVKSIEHKTYKGKVEYLMPEMGHEILRVLERWSEPLRDRLMQRLKKGDVIEHEERAHLIANQRRLFLGRQNGAPNQSCWLVAMKKFAFDAGVDWKLAPHQLRRAYAWTFVRHRLGSLLFLKEQLKHSSIDMSQLYAANPQQDVTLYDEILDEIRTQKVDIIQNWLFDDSPLAGGAGKKIMKMRAHDFPNRQAMIKETSQRVNIRSTGHGWCLAQDEGCGGSGLYERSLCGDCSNGVIDRQFSPVWEELYRHQTELLLDAEEIGTGALQRVQRDIQKSKNVLRDLGIAVEGDAQK